MKLQIRLDKGFGLIVTWSIKRIRIAVRIAAKSNDNIAAIVVVRFDKFQSRIVRPHFEGFCQFGFNKRLIIQLGSPISHTKIYILITRSNNPFRNLNLEFSRLFKLKSRFVVPEWVVGSGEQDITDRLIVSYPKNLDLKQIVSSCLNRILLVDPCFRNVVYSISKRREKYNTQPSTCSSHVLTKHEF